MSLIQERTLDLAKRYLKLLLYLLIPFFIYATVLVIDLPKEIGSAARYGVSWLLAVSAILLYVAYRVPGWLGQVLSLSLILALFALPLARLWSTGDSATFLLGGLLPWSDANNYYWSARNLLDGNRMPAWDALRPLFPGLLSVLLA